MQGKSICTQSMSKATPSNLERSATSGKNMTEDRFPNLSEFFLTLDAVLFHHSGPVRRDE